MRWGSRVALPGILLGIIVITLVTAGCDDERRERERWGYGVVIERYPERDRARERWWDQHRGERRGREWEDYRNEDEHYRGGRNRGEEEREREGRGRYGPGEEESEFSRVAAVALITERFGLTEDAVVPVARQSEPGPKDLMATYELASLTGSKDPGSVLQLKQRGMGWTDMATTLNVPARKLAPLGSDLEDGLFVKALADAFRIKASDLQKALASGTSPDDLVLALAMGAETGEKWTGLLAEQKEKQQSWLDLAQAKKVDLNDFVDLAIKLEASD